MEFAIRFVYDVDTSEMFDAKDVFKNRDLGHSFRQHFHTTDQRLYCCACHEQATISVGSKGKIHFKHFPNTSNCELKDNTFSPSGSQLIEEHVDNKESRRHKTLKLAIANYLSTTPGVDTNSLFVDDRYLKDKKEKRRPDVFCNFNGKLIAFEIQLSNLPPKYIFKRHEFYKRNEIFLLWILDDFDPTGQSQTEKDIKYLNKHQNFFFFNDASTNHSLVAQYKECHVNHSDKPYFKWTHDSIKLCDLKFDTSDYQCYFVSYEEEQKKLDLEAFKARHRYLLDSLRKFYLRDDEHLIPTFHSNIESLDVDEVGILKSMLGLEKNNDLLLKAAKSGKSNFLVYLLEQSRFNIDLYQKENESNTLLQSILLPSKMMFRWKIIQLIFHRGYTLTNSDKTFLKAHDFNDDLPVLHAQRTISIYAYNALREKRHIEWFEKIDGTVYTISSAKFNQVVGHGFQNFISLANNAIHSYRETFSFIEQAFKFYNVWNRVIAEDKKKTFLKKHEEYLLDKDHPRNAEGYIVLEILFSEVFRPAANRVEWIKLDDIQ